MAIDPKYIELIHADIDNEIDAAAKADLDAFLADSAEGRALYEAMSSLSGSLDQLPDLEPPAHLKHVLMNQAPVKTGTKPSPGFFRRLFAGPALGYVGTFAAGVVLALTLVSSKQISSGVFDDVTGLVGTMANNEFSAAEHDRIAIDARAVAGTVTLRSQGSLLILDFDLTALEPVQIDVSYADKTIWFNGFAQLESSGTSVAAETGAISLEFDGKRRFATFLNNPGNRNTTIDVRFMAAGQVAHEARLKFDR